MAYQKSKSDSHCCGKPSGQSEESPAGFCEPDSGTAGPWCGRSFGGSLERCFVFPGFAAWLTEWFQSRQVTELDHPRLLPSTCQ